MSAVDDKNIIGSDYFFMRYGGTYGFTNETVI
jgi:hypothetical protein